MFYVKPNLTLLVSGPVQWKKCLNKGFKLMMQTLRLGSKEDLSATSSGSIKAAGSKCWTGTYCILLVVLEGFWRSPSVHFFLSQNCYEINWRILKTLSLFDQKIDTNQTVSNLAERKELQGALQNEKTLIAIREWEQARCMSQRSGLVIAKPTLGDGRGLSGRSGN